MIGFMRVVVLLFGLVLASAGYAAATLEAVAGDVRAGATVPLAATASSGQTVNPGNVVTTGARSRATLRFTDGSAVALHENSEFRVAEFAYSSDNPAGDRSRFELLKGALRAVTAALTQRSPQAYSVRTPLAVIGIRGTDFMLAMVNPLFFQVLDGAISVENSAGAPVFSTGAIGTVAAEGALAVTMERDELPAGVVLVFNELSALNLASLAPAPGPAAPAVLPAGFGGIAIPAAILIGIGLGVAAGDGEDSTPSGTGTGAGTH